MNESQALPLEESSRTLAKVAKIDKIVPISGADRIVLAYVGGWRTVVRKGEFKVGERGVYFEIDSMLPECKEYSFLGSATTNPITKLTAAPSRGFRLRTVKLRGEISQGLFLPFSKLANLTEMAHSDFLAHLESLEVGTDVTSLLGVTKYDKLEANSELGLTKGHFPTHLVSKTDEARVQNSPDGFKLLHGKSFYASAKYDGTSFTIIKQGNKLTFCTRNSILTEDNRIKVILDSYGATPRLLAYEGDLILQGEFYGVGIQGNPLKIMGNRLAIFNVIRDRMLLGLKDMIVVLGELGLEMPEVNLVVMKDKSELDELISLVNSVNKDRVEVDRVRSENKSTPTKIILERVEVDEDGFTLTEEETIALANPLNYVTNGAPQEGLVFRPTSGSSADNPVSFKAISNRFLLKSE